MHTADLAVKHALSILVRKRNGVAVDECMELTNLRVRLKDLCAYIMDKRNKDR